MSATTEITRDSVIQERLAGLLADYQVLYAKLRGYHWNVAGPRFFELHAEFERLYLDTAEKVDAIAERIAARGGRPRSSLTVTLKEAELADEDRELAAGEMIEQAVLDYDRLDARLRAAASVAGEAGDAATANLLEGFADEQEKTRWMLRASLENG